MPLYKTDEERQKVIDRIDLKIKLFECTYSLSSTRNPDMVSMVDQELSCDRTKTETEKFLNVSDNKQRFIETLEEQKKNGLEYSEEASAWLEKQTHPNP